MQFVRCREFCCSLTLSLALVSPSPAHKASSAVAPSIREFFASTIQRVNFTQGSSSIPVEWTFTNRGNIPLLIERIDTSCGCLAPLIDHKQIAPGASGTIRATLTPGSLRGLLRKSLQVRFVAYDQPVELIAETFIPTSVALSQNELTWTSCESTQASATQIVDVTTGTDASFSITGLVGVHESQFTIIQKTITPEKHYQLHITPSNAKPATSISTALQIRTNSPDPRDQVLVLLLRQSAPQP